MGFKEPMNQRLVFVSGLGETMEPRLRNTLLMSGLGLVSLGALPLYHGHLARMEYQSPDPGGVLPSWNREEPFTLKPEQGRFLRKVMFSSSTFQKKNVSLIPGLYINGGKLQSLPLKVIPMKQAAEKAMAYIEKGGLKDKFMQSLHI